MTRSEWCYNCGHNLAAHSFGEMEACYYCSRTDTMNHDNRCRCRQFVNRKDTFQLIQGKFVVCESCQEHLS